MKNTETVKESLYYLFGLYRSKKIDHEELITELQLLCAGKGKKSYWWRFFPNDTMANDWQSVRSSLNSYRNTEYLHECMDIALNDRQIIVYYS
jgi:hypothetical protein